MASNTGGLAEFDNRQLFNMRLHELCTLADRSSIIDDYDNWFDALRGIKRMIHDFLTDDEKRIVDEKLLVARRWAKVGKKPYIDLEKVQDTLDDAQTTIYDYAHKYRLFTPRSDESGSGLQDVW